jgi:glutaconate CoA-transferase subunit A
LRPDVKTVVDPYNGDELIAFPAIKPDVCVIHALEADPHGNAIVGKNKGIDEELSITSDLVIITAEKIVAKLDKADIAAPFVDMVVESPMGAYPTSCHPQYPLASEEVLRYSETVSDSDSLIRFIESYLKGT